MLTKNDLSQIRKIVREEVEVESKSSKEDLRGEIKLARIEIQGDIRQLAERVKNLDQEYLKLRKRIGRLEEHLGLPSLE